MSDGMRARGGATRSGGGACAGADSYIGIGCVGANALSGAVA
jgi:hypothetical protein